MRLLIKIGSWKTKLGKVALMKNPLYYARQLLALTGTLLFVSYAVADFTIPFTPMATESNFLLQTANLQNPGGIDFRWDGLALQDSNQRTLAEFRQEMVAPGRIAGGANWDGLPDNTPIADQTGVDWDFTGLAGSLRITATAIGGPIKVWDPDLPDWPSPSSGGNVVGRASDGAFESSTSTAMILEIQPSTGLELHGFGMVLVDSGRDGGGLTLSFYNVDTLLDQFSPSDGVLFHDSATDDNFIGYWSDTAITRISMEADSEVLRGRFDDLGFVLIPEPTALTLLGLGSLVLLMGRRRG